MIEYINKKQKFKSILDIEDCNGSNIILGFLNECVYVLKSDNGRRWVNLRTARGYDNVSNYSTVKEACDKLISEGGRVLTISDPKELTNLLLTQ